MNRNSVKQGASIWIRHPLAHTMDDAGSESDEYEYEDEDADEVEEDDDDVDDIEQNGSCDDFAAALSEETSEKRQPKVQVFDEENIVAELKAEAQRASSLLNLSMSAACKVMREFDWNYDKLQDNYFEDPGILDRLGLHLGSQVVSGCLVLQRVLVLRQNNDIFPP